MGFMSGIKQAISTGVSGMKDEYLTPPNTRAIKWEYAVLQFDTSLNLLDDFRTQVNEMGSWGWELVNAVDTSMGFMRSATSDRHIMLTFKRPRA